MQGHERSLFEWAVAVRQSASANQFLTSSERLAELEQFRLAPPEIYELYLRCLSDEKLNVPQSDK